MTTDNNAAVAVRRPTGALAVTDGQVEWTDMQRAALAQMGIATASDGDKQVFLHFCQRTGLDPFARQAYMIQREGKWTIQTAIDGFRVTARRAARKAGETLSYEDPQWCGPDGVWRDVWLSAEPPAAARVCVIKTSRDGRTERFPAVARYGAYVSTKANGDPVKRWQNAADQMLSKCAEALALRMAYPHDLSGVYTDDEMDQAGNGRVIDQPAVDPVEMETRRRHYLDLVDQSADVESVRGIWRMAGEACQAREITPTVLDDIALACKARGAELAAATAPPAEPTARVLISQPQSKRLHVLLARHNITVREDKLDVLSRMVGRRLESSADLTGVEANTVISRLDSVEDFSAWFAELVESTEGGGAEPEQGELA